MSGMGMPPCTQRRPISTRPGRSITVAGLKQGCFNEIYRYRGARAAVGLCINANGAERAAARFSEFDQVAGRVAFCIANKNNVPALDAPDGAKVIQIKNGYGAVGMIFSVYADGAWSRIEVRKPIGVSLAAHRQCY